MANQSSVDRKIAEETSETPTTLRYTRFDEGEGDRNKFKKVEMPMFNGTDPDSWLFRADFYFKIHRLSEDYTMTVTIINFKSTALN